MTDKALDVVEEVSGQWGHRVRFASRIIQW